MTTIPTVPMADIDAAFSAAPQPAQQQPVKDLDRLMDKSTTDATAELARLLSGSVPPKMQDGVVHIDSMVDVMKMAQHYYKAGMVPESFYKDTNNKSETVIRRVAVAIEYGAGVGFTPLQSLSFVMPINGRPMLWGDGPISLVMQHKAYGGHRVEWSDDDSSVTFSVCRIVGGNPSWTSWTYTMEDAKLAGLLGKGMAWPKHTRRMMFNRARAFALRDAFPDALRGAGLADEFLDDQQAEKLASEEKTAQLASKVAVVKIEEA